MKKRLLAAVLTAAALISLCGCEKQPEETLAETVMATETVEETVPPTIPADGNKNDVTCKGSYTDRGQAGTVAAKIGSERLTNGELTAWYWAEVASYRQSGQEIQPDYEKALDTQVCEMDDSVNSWQQYFLKRALQRWHTAQALVLQGEEVGLPEEEAHQPDPEKYETYLKDIPATQYLYRYEKSFSPNTMHQAYLDSLPELLVQLAQKQDYEDLETMAEESLHTTGEAVLHWAELYNRGYMYFTNLTYFLEPTEEEAAVLAEKAEGEVYSVDLRLLLHKGSQEDAEKMLADWKRGYPSTESSFADLARKNSKDTGASINGGYYENLTRGQLDQTLEQWCFDPARKAGDTTVIRTADGNFLLYFCGGKSEGYAQAEAELLEEKRAGLLTGAREQYPMEVMYESISLTAGEAGISYENVLYADVAHERFPEVPLYLQANYPASKYGSYRLSTHGCGITSMAMLATYMADDELTPPELASRFGRYCFEKGTDGSLFINEPPAMGFFLKERTFDYRRAKELLDAGYIVVVSESKGYWTRGGHFLVLEDIDEKDMVLVRDSNIYNYQKISTFKEDRHPWDKIYPAGKSYWAYEDKITRIPACERCGEGEGVLEGTYLCEKCTPALLRRDSYLNGVE